jgi:ribosomal protein S18 acetylase RimI-like enzyme
VLFHRDTWRLLGVGIKIWRIRGSRQYISLEEYPAHLHVNVQKEYRGGKIGQHLLEKFLDQMKAAQAKGVHLCTRADNLRGQHFFQKMGFTELTRYPTVRLSRGREDISYNIIYGKRIT